ncbi:MAG: hypothetical protein LBI61_02700 [Puniceicoccales bacterium]|nr:hypothetical protein [Puniceicoccales bacterium]
MSTARRKLFKENSALKFFTVKILNLVKYSLCLYGFKSLLERESSSYPSPFDASTKCENFKACGLDSGNDKDKGSKSSKQPASKTKDKFREAAKKAFRTQPVVGNVWLDNIWLIEKMCEVGEILPGI